MTQTPPRPLTRFSVVDLTTVRSGPTCTKILADFGADVLRVERPGGEGRERVFFDAADLHRNKRSIAVNLQDPRGVAIVKRLAARCDVVVENYRPDVKHRLGVDYETLSRDNPRLVYASISGFGQEGPYRDRPGYDQIVQGMSGLMWLTGTAESAPLRVGIPIGDLLAGYFAAVGILTALLERESSGRGQKVETSLLEALTGSLSFQAAKYVNTGEVPPPVGNHHPLTAPMGVYRARDGFFNLAVGNDDMWRRFCKVLDQPALADDPRFAGMLSRVKHRQALDTALEAAFARRTAAEWVETLNAAGVASGPIYTVDQVFADPQIRRADLVREVANDTWGPHKVLALPVHLSRTPARVERAAPMTGEHTREVLGSLGYDAVTLDTLLAEGVIEQHKGETP
ncbi:MAG TPA: CoA transferase [Methylomirabilota bacterium]|nr:CoA transferase [Methylomirabilota bacterium]